MGIWNVRFSEGRLMPIGLITPHGDLERRLVKKVGKGILPHNPSWGFGTIEMDKGENLVELLITPHGDLERIFTTFAIF